MFFALSRNSTFVSALFSVTVNGRVSEFEWVPTGVHAPSLYRCSTSYVLKLSAIDAPNVRVNDCLGDNSAFCAGDVNAAGGAILWDTRLPRTYQNPSVCLPLVGYVPYIAVILDWTKEPITSLVRTLPISFSAAVAEI